MKFKMAENSLFAILLRSRWWVSFLVGAIWALLAAALVPQPYKFVGILGSLPFWCLGFVAFIRQLDTPSSSQQQAILQHAGQQNWADFSAALQSAWQAEGYTVERAAPGSAHDFVLHRQGKITVALAKRWKAINHGVEPLRGLLQAQKELGAHTSAYLCIVGLQDKAQDFADAQHIAVISSTDLATLLQKQSKAPRA